MNQQKAKTLRKQFETFYGSDDRTTGAYKYMWRLFKKTASDGRRKNYMNGGKRVK